jgi:hypothetical protein
LVLHMLAATAAAILAIYRIAFMVAREEGPFDVFDRLRRWANDALPARASHNRVTPHWIARGLACPLCISWWLALPAALIVVLLFGQHPAIGLLLWPAIAGGALFLFQLGGT